MGVTSATIYRYLRMSNVNDKLHQQTILNRYKDVIEPIVEKYTNGAKVADICRDLNIPISQVNSVLMLLGLKMPKRQ